MRSNAPLKIAIVLVTAAALAGCAPKPPKGVKEDVLTAAIGGAVGDPNTCVALAEAGTGKIIWKYESLAECGRALPACSSAGTRTTLDLAKAIAQNGAVVHEGCSNVSWAGGPTPRAGVVYAAVMQGGRAMPGMMMAERLDRAFKESGF